MKNLLLLLLSFILCLSSLPAQQIDILLKGGHVMDPKNGIDAPMDVAIKDNKIQEVAADIPASNAVQVVDVSGMYVMPGLIDIHTHNFWGTEDDKYLRNSYTALPPDGFGFRAGVTTMVDAGSSGWKNFSQFKEQTIDQSKTRVLCFLNIVGEGMAGGALEQNLGDMDAKLTAMVAKENAEHIVGIKLAHYYGPEWIPTERAVEAGEQANIPVMIDFGGYDPELSIETLFLEKLRPGDIFTHCYAHVDRRIPIVDEAGKVRPFVFKAQERGIIFDVGHGGGSFLFEQAVPAIEQGLKPNSISTDLHTGSMNSAMKDMVNVMSKLLNIGLSLSEVVERSTWNPASIIQRTELGHLSPGAGADVAVLRMEEGVFGFIDVQGWKVEGDKRLICELTIRDGKVVWDLNGISRPSWKK
ncbi:MAG: amidohydrolase/deacetylase family metallohydrolase [Bacteroidota bacterium]